MTGVTLHIYDQDTPDITAGTPLSEPLWSLPPGPRVAKVKWRTTGGTWVDNRYALQATPWSFSPLDGGAVNIVPPEYAMYMAHVDAQVGSEEVLFPIRPLILRGAIIGYRGLAQAAKAGRVNWYLLDRPAPTLPGVTPLHKDWLEIPDAVRGWAEALGCAPTEPTPDRYLLVGPAKFEAEAFEAGYVSKVETTATPHEYSELHKEIDTRRAINGAAAKGCPGYFFMRDWGEA